MKWNLITKILIVFFILNSSVIFINSATSCVQTIILQGNSGGNDAVLSPSYLVANTIMFTVNFGANIDQNAYGAMTIECMTPPQSFTKMANQIATNTNFIQYTLATTTTMLSTTAGQNGACKCSVLSSDGLTYTVMETMGVLRPWPQQFNQSNGLSNFGYMYAGLTQIIINQMDQVVCIGCIKSITYVATGKTSVYISQAAITTDGTKFMGYNLYFPSAGAWNPIYLFSDTFNQDNGNFIMNVLALPTCITTAIATLSSDSTQWQVTLTFSSLPVSNPMIITLTNLSGNIVTMTAAAMNAYTNPLATKVMTFSAAKSLFLGAPYAVVAKDSFLNPTIIKCPGIYDLPIINMISPVQIYSSAQVSFVATFFNGIDPNKIPLYLKDSSGNTYTLLAKSYTTYSVTLYSNSHFVPGLYTVVLSSDTSNTYNYTVTFNILVSYVSLSAYAWSAYTNISLTLTLLDNVKTSQITYLRFKNTSTGAVFNGSISSFTTNTVSTLTVTLGSNGLTTPGTYYIGIFGGQCDNLYSTTTFASWGAFSSTPAFSIDGNPMSISFTTDQLLYPGFIMNAMLIDSSTVTHYLTIPTATTSTASYTATSASLPAGKYTNVAIVDMNYNYAWNSKSVYYVYMSSSITSISFVSVTDTIIPVNYVTGGNTIVSDIGWYYLTGVYGHTCASVDSIPHTAILLTVTCNIPYPGIYQIGTKDANYSATNYVAISTGLMTVTGTSTNVITSDGSTTAKLFDGSNFILVVTLTSAHASSVSFNAAVLYDSTGTLAYTLSTGTITGALTVTFNQSNNSVKPGKYTIAFSDSNSGTYTCTPQILVGLKVNSIYPQDVPQTPNTVIMKLTFSQILSSSLVNTMTVYNSGNTSAGTLTFVNPSPTTSITQDVTGVITGTGLMTIKILDNNTATCVTGTFNVYGIASYTQPTDTYISNYTVKVTFVGGITSTTFVTGLALFASPYTPYLFLTSSTVYSDGTYLTAITPDVNIPAGKYNIGIVDSSTGIYNNKILVFNNYVIAIHIDSISIYEYAINQAFIITVTFHNNLSTGQITSVDLYTVSGAQTPSLVGTQGTYNTYVTSSQSISVSGTFTLKSKDNSTTPILTSATQTFIIYKISSWTQTTNGTTLIPTLVDGISFILKITLSSPLATITFTKVELWDGAGIITYALYTLTTPTYVSSPASVITTDNVNNPVLPGDYIIVVTDSNGSTLNATPHLQVGLIVTAISPKEVPSGQQVFMNLTFSESLSSAQIGSITAYTSASAAVGTFTFVNAGVTSNTQDIKGTITATNNGVITLKIVDNNSLLIIAGTINVYGATCTPATQLFAPNLTEKIAFSQAVLLTTFTTYISLNLSPTTIYYFVTSSAKASDNLSVTAITPEKVIPTGTYTIFITDSNTGIYKNVVSVNTAYLLTANIDSVTINEFAVGLPHIITLTFHNNLYANQIALVNVYSGNSASPQTLTFGGGTQGINTYQTISQKIATSGAFTLKATDNLGALITYTTAFICYDLGSYTITSDGTTTITPVDATQFTLTITLTTAVITTTFLQAQLYDGAGIIATPLYYLSIPTLDSTKLKITTKSNNINSPVKPGDYILKITDSNYSQLTSTTHLQIGLRTTSFSPKEVPTNQIVYINLNFSQNLLAGQIQFVKLYKADGTTVAVSFSFSNTVTTNTLDIYGTISGYGTMTIKITDNLNIVVTVGTINVYGNTFTAATQLYGPTLTEKVAFTQAVLLTTFTTAIYQSASPYFAYSFLTSSSRATDNLSVTAITPATVIPTGSYTLKLTDSNLGVYKNVISITTPYVLSPHIDSVDIYEFAVGQPHAITLTFHNNLYSGQIISIDIYSGGSSSPTLPSFTAGTPGIQTILTASVFFLTHGAYSLKAKDNSSTPVLIQYGTTANFIVYQITNYAFTDGTNAITQLIDATQFTINITLSDTLTVTTFTKIELFDGLSVIKTALYTLNTPTFASTIISSSLNSVIPGNYIIKITDSNSSKIASSVNLLVGLKLVTTYPAEFLTGQAVVVVCTFSQILNSGQVTKVDLYSGGTINTLVKFTFTLDITKNSLSFAGTFPAAGTYTLKITDNNSLTTSTGNIVVYAMTSILPLSIFSGNSLNLTLILPTSPQSYYTSAYLLDIYGNYYYLFAPPPRPATTVIFTSTAILGPGSYSLQITDSNNSNYIINPNFVIAPVPLTFVILDWAVSSSIVITVLFNANINTADLPTLYYGGTNIMTASSTSGTYYYPAPFVIATAGLYSVTAKDTLTTTIISSATSTSINVYNLTTCPATPTVTGSVIADGSTFTMKITLTTAVTTITFAYAKLYNSNSLSTVLILTTPTLDRSGLFLTTNNYTQNVLPASYILKVTDSNGTETACTTNLFIGLQVANFSPVQIAAGIVLTVTVTFSHNIAPNQITSLNFYDISNNLVTSTLNTITANQKQLTATATFTNIGVYTIQVVDSLTTNVTIYYAPTITVYNVTSYTRSSFFGSVNSVVTFSSPLALTFTGSYYNGGTSSTLGTPTFDSTKTMLTFTDPGAIASNTYTLKITDLNTSVITVGTNIIVAPNISTFDNTEWAANKPFKITTTLSSSLISSDISTLALYSTSTGSLVQALTFTTNAPSGTTMISDTITMTTFGTYQLWATDLLTNTQQFGYATNLNIYDILTVPNTTRLYSSIPVQPLDQDPFVITVTLTNAVTKTTFSKATLTNKAGGATILLSTLPTLNAAKTVITITGLSSDLVIPGAYTLTLPDSNSTVLILGDFLVALKIVSVTPIVYYNQLVTIIVTFKSNTLLPYVAPNGLIAYGNSGNVQCSSVAQGTSNTILIAQCTFTSTIDSYKLKVTDQLSPALTVTSPTATTTYSIKYTPIINPSWYVAGVGFTFNLVMTQAFTGTFTATLTSGTAIPIDNVSNFLTTLTTGNVAGNIGPGQYTLTVTDPNSTVITLTGYIVIIPVITLVNILEFKAKAAMILTLTFTNNIASNQIKAIGLYANPNDLTPKFALGADQTQIITNTIKSVTNSIVTYGVYTIFATDNLTPAHAVAYKNTITIYDFAPYVYSNVVAFTKFSITLTLTNTLINTGFGVIIYDSVSSAPFTLTVAKSGLNLLCSDPSNLVVPGSYNLKVIDTPNLTETDPSVALVVLLNIMSFTPKEVAADSAFTLSIVFSHNIKNSGQIANLSMYLGTTQFNFSNININTSSSTVTATGTIPKASVGTFTVKATDNFGNQVSCTQSLTVYTISSATYPTPLYSGSAFSVSLVLSSALLTLTFTDISLYLNGTSKFSLSTITQSGTSLIASNTGSLAPGLYTIKTTDSGSAVILSVQTVLINLNLVSFTPYELPSGQSITTTLTFNNNLTASEISLISIYNTVGTKFALTPGTIDITKTTILATSVNIAANGIYYLKTSDNLTSPNGPNEVTTLNNNFIIYNIILQSTSTVVAWSGFVVNITLSIGLTNTKITNVNLYPNGGGASVALNLLTFAYNNPVVVANDLTNIVAPGTYVVKITDSNNYVMTTPNTLTINAEPLAINVQEWAINSGITIVLTVTTAVSTKKISTVTIGGTGLTLGTLNTSTNQMTVTLPGGMPNTGLYDFVLKDGNTPPNATKPSSQVTIYNILSNTQALYSANVSLSLTVTLTVGLLQTVISSANLYDKNNVVSALVKSNFTASTVIFTYAPYIQPGLYTLKTTDSNGSTLTAPTQIVVKMLIMSISPMEFPTSTTFTITITFSHKLRVGQITKIRMANSNNTFNLTYPQTLDTTVKTVVATLTGGLASIGTYNLYVTDDMTSANEISATNTVNLYTMNSYTALTGTAYNPFSLNIIFSQFLIISITNVVIIPDTSPSTPVPLTVGTYAPSTGTLTVSTPTAINSPDAYTIQTTDNQGYNIIYNQPKYILILGITSLSTTFFQANTTGSFSITFTSLLNANQYSTVSQVTFTGPDSTPIVATLSSATSMTLPLTVAFKNAGKYTINAYDSRSSAPMTTTVISVIMNIISVLKTVFQANNLVSLQITFDENLSSNSFTNISSVTLTNASNLRTVLSRVTVSNTVQNVISGPTGYATAGLYILNAYDTLNNVILSPYKITIILQVVNFTPTFFQENAAISCVLTFSENLNSSKYTTITGVSLTDTNSSVTPLTLTTVNPTSPKNLIVTLPAGLSSLDLFTISATSQNNDITVVTSQILTAMNISAIAPSVFIVSSPITFIITFSDTLNVSKFTTVNFVQLKSGVLGTLITISLGTVTGKNLQVTYPSGLLEADLWSIYVIDANGNTISTILQLNITEFIQDFNPKYIPVNTTFSITLTFIANLNTNLMTTISRVALRNSALTITSITQGQVTNNMLVCSFTGGFANYGLYDIIAYDSQSNMILTKGTQLVFTMKMISFTPALFVENTSFSISILFSSLLFNGDNYSGISSVSLVSSVTGTSTQIKMSFKVSNTNTLVVFNNLSIAGVYNIIAYDLNFFPITSPSGLNIMASGNCLLNANSAYIYYSNGYCVATCPSGTLPDPYNTCISTTPSTVYISYGTAVSQCPAGQTLGTDLKNCFTCISKNLFYLNQACLAACPAGYSYNSSNICQSCGSAIPPTYNHNNVCVATCLPSQIIDINNFVCSDCLAGQFVLANACVTSCPSFYTALLGVCTACVPQQYFYNNACYVTCPVGFNNQINMTCQANIVAIAIAEASTNLCTSGLCNLGTCVVVLNKATCICTVNTYGSNCQFASTDLATAGASYDSMTQNLNPLASQNVGLSSSQSNQLLSYTILIGQVPSLATPARVGMIANIATNQMSGMTVGLIPVDPSLITVSDRTIGLLLSSYSQTINKTPALATTIDTYVSTLKSSVLSIAQNLVSSYNFTLATNHSLLYGGNYITTQVGIGSSDYTNTALANNLSVLSVNLSPGNTDQIILTKTEISPAITGKVSQRRLSSTYPDYTNNTNSVQFLFSAQNNRMVYNFTDPFASLNVSLKILPNANLNLTFYNIMSNQSIDVYNPYSAAFTSRCLVMVDSSTGWDTTINYRRLNYYQNFSASCGTGCTYLGIDTNSYINCLCSVNTTSVSSHFQVYYINTVSNFNLGLMWCQSNILKSNLLKNAGFWVTVGLVAASVFFVLFLFLLNKNAIKNSLVSLLYNDGILIGKFNYEVSHDKNVVVPIAVGGPKKTGKTIVMGEDSDADDFGNVQMDNVSPPAKKGRTIVMGDDDEISEHINPEINEIDVTILPVPINDTDYDLLGKIDISLNTTKKNVSMPEIEIKKHDLSRLNNTVSIIQEHNDEYIMTAKPKKNRRGKVSDSNNFVKSVQETDQEGGNLMVNQPVSLLNNPTKTHFKDTTIDNNLTLHTRPINESPMINNLTVSSSKNLIDKVPKKVDDQIDEEKDIKLDDRVYIENDTRGFWRYICDYLSVEHILFSLFKKSLFEPYWIRCLFLIFSINIEFALNAMLNSDDWIDQKSQYPNSTRVNYILNYLF